MAEYIEKGALIDWLMPYVHLDEKVDPDSLIEDIREMRAAEAVPVVQELREQLAKVTAERDAAVKTIFQWTGCPECRQWESENNWCKKHDREADSTDGCDSPEWRGIQED